MIMAAINEARNVKLCVLGNFCPETVEEAFAMSPSIKGCSCKSLDFDSDVHKWLKTKILEFHGLFVNSLMLLNPCDGKSEKDEGQMIVECFRGRLLRERQALKSAKEDAEVIGNKVCFCSINVDLKAQAKTIGAES
ncbi:hypothetical protein COLO4_19742 [Corchorus olitorius]|uniref:Uncharacterized protein n=1 Tax=Corchorus olitorius TaxID=93759 RepID=A0A1R3J3R0_9ROSI|nr:hypothetical protein COLO4_19742 [Corchorus olitorius]